MSPAPGASLGSVSLLQAAAALQPTTDDPAPQRGQDRRDHGAAHLRHAHRSTGRLVPGRAAAHVLRPRAAVLPLRETLHALVAPGSQHLQTRMPVYFDRAKTRWRFSFNRVIK